MAHLRKTRLLPNTNIFLWIYRHFLLALYLSFVDLNPLKIINYLTHCNHNISIPIWGDWERNFSYQKVKAANSINFNALSALVLSHWKPKKKCFYFFSYRFTEPWKRLPPLNTLIACSNYSMHIQGYSVLNQLLP